MVKLEEYNKVISVSTKIAESALNMKQENEKLKQEIESLKQKNDELDEKLFIHETIMKDKNKKISEYINELDNKNVLIAQLKRDIMKSEYREQLYLQSMMCKHADNIKNTSKANIENKIHRAANKLMESNNADIIMGPNAPQDLRILKLWDLD